MVKLERIYTTSLQRIVELHPSIVHYHQDSHFNLPYYTTDYVGRFLHILIDVLPHSEEVIILLDLDDTAITFSKEVLFGSGQTFSYMKEQVMRAHNICADQAGEKIFNLFYHMQHYNPFHLTDHTLVDAVQKIRTKNIRIYGFTARDDRFIALTKKQLKTINIQFCTLSSSTLPINPYPIYTIKEGVFFLGGNEKSQAFSILHKEGYFGETQTSVVVFLDDHKSSIESFMQLFNMHYKDTALIPVWCTFTQKHYEQTMSKEYFREGAIKFLYTHRKKPDIQALISQDPFTRSLITESPKIQSNNKKITTMFQKLRSMAG